MGGAQKSDYYSSREVKISVIILCNSLTQMKFKQSSSRFHLGLNKVGSS